MVSVTFSIGSISGNFIGVRAHECFEKPDAGLFGYPKSPPNIYLFCVLHNNVDEVVTSIAQPTVLHLVH